jgi:hypothetical protein
MKIPEEVVESPWRVLVDMGKVLSVPNDDDVEDGGEGVVVLSDAMAAAWSAGEGLRDFNKRAGVDYDARELQGLLRRRVDCWR